LSSAIQCKTISYDFSSSAESPQTDYTQLTKLHKLLATSFPMAHKLLKKEVSERSEASDPFGRREYESQQQQILTSLSPVPSLKMRLARRSK